MKLPQIHSRQELVALVQELGFLPFFSNEIEGFSLEDCIAPSCWYGGPWDGRIDWPAWEWKGEITAAKELVYGKLFHKKAGFVSPLWLPALCNYRRDGYDFDARYEDGLASRKDKFIIDYLTAHGSCLSKELKKAGDYRKGGNVGFETVITRLQMQTYVTVADFEYSRDKQGSTYGWGVARYTLSEAYWGNDLCRGAYREQPEESLAVLMDALHRILTGVPDQKLLHLIR